MTRVFLLVISTPLAAWGQIDRGLQLADNPPMKVIAEGLPPTPEADARFETREGFALVESLAELRQCFKKSGQKVRMKPGVYRAEEVAPPVDGAQQIFAVTGSDNHFDLRGVVIETPVSLQGVLSNAPHVSDSWRVNGDRNTFEGGDFRNVLDQDYPDYRVTENEFEVRGDGNTFLGCTFVVLGSVPYGYTDYYGKGGPNFGRLDKHCFLSIVDARDTRLVGCRVYLRSFGHCVHFHGARGVLIKGCHFSGVLRPTNDIYEEKVGRAAEYGFKAMYRGERPIPRDEVIPLTEDGVRTYGGDSDITVVDTTVERMRGCFQLLCEGDVTLRNVTVREAGDFAFDVSAGDKGRVVVENCSADLAYNPVFNLTRGPKPIDAFYEVTILSPAEGAAPTPRTSLGVICGDRCTFILRDGATRPLPAESNYLRCGGRHGLSNSTVKNYTPAKLMLDERVRGCRIESVGPVEDRGEGNEIVSLGSSN